MHRCSNFHFIYFSNALLLLIPHHRVIVVYIVPCHRHRIIIIISFVSNGNCTTKQQGIMEITIEPAEWDDRSGVNRHGTRAGLSPHLVRIIINAHQLTLNIECQRWWATQDCPNSIFHLVSHRDGDRTKVSSLLAMWVDTIRVRNCIKWYLQRKRVLLFEWRRSKYVDDIGQVNIWRNLTFKAKRLGWNDKENLSTYFFWQSEKIEESRPLRTGSL